MDYYYYYSIFHVNKTENTAVSAIEIRKVCEQTKVFKRAIGIRKRHSTCNDRPYISDEKWAKEHLNDSKANKSAITTSIIHAPSNTRR